MRSTLDPRLGDVRLLRMAALRAQYRQQQKQQEASQGPQDWPHGSKDPADMALRADCRYNWPRFATHFFPHIFTLPFNQVHDDYYALKATRQGARGFRDVVAAPRGSSKTSGCALLTGLHAGCYPGEESFILYASNSSENAVAKVRQVRDELDENEEVTRVFGPRRGTPWNNGYWETVDHTTMLAIGRLTAIRGRTVRFRRFSLLLIDDIEHPEQVLSELQRDRTRKWLQDDILKLGTPQTNVEVSGTVLHPQSLLRELLDNPGWHARFYQAVTSFASAESVPLWQVWRELFLNKANETHQEDARAFFEAHEAAMTAGATVLWPAYKDYYALMVERLVEGNTSFFREMMNDPMGDERYLFDMEHAGFCALMPEGIRRADGSFVPWLDVPEFAAFFDPALGRGKDCACCVVVARDRHGFEYVLDAYVTNTDNPEAQDEAICELLWRWQCQLLGVEANGFQSLLPRNIREAMARREQVEGQTFGLKIVPITHTRNKMLRCRTLEPLVTNRWLQFSRNLPPEYFRQFENFIPIDGAGRDDCLDATEACVSLVRGVQRKQDAA